MARIQAENVHNVKKMCFWQKAPGVNGLIKLGFTHASRLACESHTHGRETINSPLTFFLHAETAQAKETKCSIERTPKEFLCLWRQEVQTLEGFQDLLTTVLKINLDPKRALGGDFRSLAGAFKKDMKYIWFLESKASPTEELLKECRPTLKFLKDMLLSKEMGRDDVAKEITAWVEKKCGCSNCCSSLR